MKGTRAIGDGQKVVAVLWSYKGLEWRVAETILPCLKKAVDTKNDVLNVFLRAGIDPDEYVSGRQRQRLAVSGAVKALHIIESHVEDVYTVEIYGDGATYERRGYQIHGLPASAYKDDYNDQAWKTLQKALDNYGFYMSKGELESD